MSGSSHTGHNLPGSKHGQQGLPLLHSNEHLQSLGQTFVLSLHNTRASWSSAGWPRAKKHGCNHAAQVKESIPLSEFGWAHGICENDLVNLLRRSLSKFFVTCSRVRTEEGEGRGGEGRATAGIVFFPSIISRSTAMNDIERAAQDFNGEGHQI